MVVHLDYHGFTVVDGSPFGLPWLHETHKSRCSPELDEASRVLLCFGCCFRSLPPFQRSVPASCIRARQESYSVLCITLATLKVFPGPPRGGCELDPCFILLNRRKVTCIFCFAKLRILKVYPFDRSIKLFLLVKTKKWQSFRVMGDRCDSL